MQRVPASLPIHLPQRLAGEVRQHCTFIVRRFPAHALIDAPCRSCEIVRWGLPSMRFSAREPIGGPHRACCNDAKENACSSLHHVDAG